MSIDEKATAEAWAAMALQLQAAEARTKAAEARAEKAEAILADVEDAAARLYRESFRSAVWFSRAEGGAAPIVRVVQQLVVQKQQERYQAGRDLEREREAAETRAAEQADAARWRAFREAMGALLAPPASGAEGAR